VIAIVFFLLLTAGAGAGNDLRPTVTHVVTNGETLWSIAARHTAPGDDVRAVVFDIKRINDLDDSMIRIGDRLVVPVES
jgi:LysM repeat protein